MDFPANVVVVMGRCCRSSEGFGMRFEGRSWQQWEANWAFPIQERLARKEGYDQSEIKGNILLANEYPGCPYCGNASVIRCARCERVSCYDGQLHTASCGWCGWRGPVAGYIDRLSAGGDAF